MNPYIYIYMLLYTNIHIYTTARLVAGVVFLGPNGFENCGKWGQYVTGYPSGHQVCSFSLWKYHVVV